MRVVASFALTQPRRTVVLIRSQSRPTASTHPLNEGLLRDVDAAAAQLSERPEARRTGVLYWLGLCQILMLYLVEQRPDAEEASERLYDMLMLGLTGLGVAEARAMEIAGAARLPQGIRKK